MNNITRIILRGESQLQNARVIFKDRLAIEADQISYQYHPLFKTARDPMRKWEASIESNACYEEVCQKVSAVLEFENPGHHPEMPVREFEVTCEDGSTRKEKFYIPLDKFQECFDAMKKMIPAGEEMPECLKGEEDW